MIKAIHKGRVNKDNPKAYQVLWELSEFIPYKSLDITRYTDHIVTSKNNDGQLLAFPADRNGAILSYMDLGRSDTHISALTNQGYAVSIPLTKNGEITKVYAYYPNGKRIISGS